MEKSIFQTLFEVNCNNHIEKKNGLSYLSWPFAWAEVKKVDPEANYKIYENAEGWNYFTDGKTCWVKTGVTIKGIEHIEYLPVMDFKNKSIPAESVTSFDVNKTIQRSLTKACARHGLGLYIYAGEDLPEGEEKPATKKVTETPTVIGVAKVNTLRNRIKGAEMDEAFVCGMYKHKALEEFTETQFINCMDNFDKVVEKWTSKAN